jgi:hypothetical protein
MNGEPPPSGADAGGDDELGPPLDELRALALPLAANFPDKVRGRIERRLLTVELIDLAWVAPLAALLALLRAPLEALTSGRRR